MEHLLSLGLKPQMLAELSVRGQEARHVARVITEHKNSYEIVIMEAEKPRVLSAKLSGRFSFQAGRRLDLPAVGDFVLLRPISGDGDWVLIDEVLPRHSMLVRKAAGSDNQEQIIGTNIDTVFVVSSMNLDWNERRIERYLALVWNSGAVPVLIMTKADLCTDQEPLLARAKAVGNSGVAVLALSAQTGEGLEHLRPYLGRGQTIALIGSSGVGKSTLVNRLTGGELQAVQGISNHLDKGRHTTAGRSLIFLSDGAALIDTPGMRELMPWDAGDAIDATYSDIEALQLLCKFSNCSHTSEPDCAVMNAIATEVLSPSRWQGYLKLQKEAAYLARKSDVQLAAQEKRKWKKIHQELRQHYKKR